MAEQTPYSGQRPNPFGSSPFPSDGGNPANRGFAPQTSVSTGGGAIVDMILNMLLSSATKKMGVSIPTFGRPQMSDYADRMMKDRESKASEMMSGIYGSSPSSKMFGPLGDNALSQQFGDMFVQSGGSRGEAFKQVFGRFGNQFGGAGPGGIDTAGKASARVIENMDNQFTDRDTGAWQYGKTGGFNRQNTINAVAEFSDQFGGGGKEAIAKMSEVRTEGALGNSKEIDAAGKQIQGITEVVREAGNFFGPNMPFGQLVKEMKILADGAKGVSTAELKSSLQQVQGMAVAVDMSNEAFANYMKVIEQINGDAKIGMSTKDLSIQSMASGKAQEDLEKRRAESRGEVYTGPSKEEIGMEDAKLITDRETSLNAINSGIMVSGLSGEKGPEAQEIITLQAKGQFKEAMDLYDKYSSEGKISGDAQAHINKAQSDFASGKTKYGDAEKKRERQVAVSRGLGEEWDNRKDSNEVAKATIREKMETDFFSNRANVDLVGGKENQEKIIQKLQSGWISSEAEMLDTDKMARDLMEDKSLGYDEKKAMEVAKSLSESERSGWDTETGNDTLLRNLGKEKKEEAKKVKQNQKDHTAAAAAASEEGYTSKSDAGILEQGAEVAGTIYTDMKKDGGPVTAERFLKFAKVALRDKRGGGTESQQNARFEKMFRDQQHTDVYKEERDKLKASGLSDEEAEKQAGKIANEKVYGKDTWEYAEKQRQDADKKKIEKQADKDGLTGETKTKFVKEETEKLANERTKAQFGEESDRSEKGSERSKEESKKDEAAERMIKAIEANTAALNPLGTAIKGLADIWMKSPGGWLLNKITGGGDDKVANG